MEDFVISEYSLRNSFCNQRLKVYIIVKLIISQITIYKLRNVVLTTIM